MLKFSLACAFLAAVPPCLTAEESEAPRREELPHERSSRGAAPLSPRSPHQDAGPVLREAAGEPRIVASLDLYERKLAMHGGVPQWDTPKSDAGGDASEAGSKERPPRPDASRQEPGGPSLVLAGLVFGAFLLLVVRLRRSIAAGGD